MALAPLDKSGLTAAPVAVSRRALWWWGAGVALLCALPLILLGLGADFSSDGAPLTPEGVVGLSESELTHAAHHALCGSFTHTLLEWTAVCAAVFVGVLLFVQYRLTREVSLPIIGIALMCAGAMDAFHTFAADRLIESVADNRNLIPFTWAICRLFNGAIQVVGVGIFALWVRQRTSISGAGIIAIGAGFVLTSYAIVNHCATSNTLPTTMYPEALIARPFDIYPLIPYCICAFVIFPLYLKRRPTLFACALVLSPIPQIATQLYMAFGSTALHDSAFNIAHGVKAVAYLVPVVGLLAEIVHTHHAQKRAESGLKESNAATLRALAQEKHTSAMLEATNAQLEEAKCKVEAAAQAKSAFLANMSHEIRTPMTSILGFAENLLDVEQSDSDRLNAVHTICRNGDHLLSIVNDILDLSKIEAGKMSVEGVACSPCEIIAGVASLVRVQADGKSLDFTTEYDGPIPETIRSDPTRLRQILINLIGNAIKFTEYGSVRLVTRFVDDSDAPLMQFDVVDTGLGMTAQQVDKLFSPFTQADASTTRQYGGTGLGLSISKRFAELLGGEIVVVDTREGEGTTIRATVAAGSLEGVPMIADPASATLAAATHGAAEEACVDQTSLEGCRVLLAEDGMDNQRLITHVLRRAGAQVIVEENGRLAVDAALAAWQRRRKSDPHRPFDVILMDMQMPVMDGYEATRLLRQKGYDRPIIALTAHAMADDRKKCIDAGCDDYATKPIDRTKLIETIRVHLTPTPKAQPVDAVS